MKEGLMQVMDTCYERGSKANCFSSFVFVVNCLVLVVGEDIKCIL